VEILEPQTDPVRLRPPGKPGLKLGLVETLDRAGIDRMFANRVAMGPGLPPERFPWVAFADALMYPFPTEVLEINPDRKTFFALEAKLLERYYKESRVTARPASLEEYVRRVVLARSNPLLLQGLFNVPPGALGPGPEHPRLAGTHAGKSHVRHGRQPLRAGRRLRLERRHCDGIGGRA
jgi:hypothetical protein